MSQTRGASPPMPRRLLTGLLIAIFFFAIVQSARLLPTLGAGGNLVDFDAFYMVGQMAWQGHLADAYDMPLMADLQRALVGHEGFMPWTYPPPFDLVTLILPLAPRGLAYGLFTGATLAFYLLVLARLAGPRLFEVLLALAPPIYVSATIGQNAFLTGGLIALFCLLSLRPEPGGAAGWPLGLLVIKPHLGVGLGVYALASRRWRVLALALAVALALSALATGVFGAGIWVAFHAGVAQAGAALQAGLYPLFRMTSAYALLHTLGVAPGLAVWIQIAVGVGAVAVVVLVVVRGAPTRQALAVACFASALVSPYLYDYDMTIVGAGIALIAGDVIARTSRIERGLLLALIWVAGGWGMIHALASADLPWEERAAMARATLSYGALAYGLSLALVWRILRRPAPDAAAT